MKDYPIGTVFTDAQGVRLEVVEQRGCDGCYYTNDDTDVECTIPKVECECEAYHRSDRTGVIFRKVAPTICHFTQRNSIQ